MIGLDTNVLLRALIRDDHQQSRTAQDYIISNCSPESPGYINLTVLVEFVWVVSKAYKFPKTEVIEMLKDLFTTEEFNIEKENTVYQALVDFGHGRADFSDYLSGLINKNAGCMTTATFDKKASEHHSFTLL